MNKRNLILNTAIASAFAALSGSAFATVTLDPVTASTPAKYASELVSDNVTLTNAATSLQLSFKPTWGVAAGNHLYVRIDLTNGKFKTALANTSLATAPTTTETVSISAGGTTGSTFVIFDVSDTAGVQLTHTYDLTPADLTMVSAASDISAKVSFYTDASAASAGSSATVGTVLSGAYVTKAAALTTTFAPDTTTAVVPKDFKEFAASSTTGGPVAGKTALLGKVSTVLNSVLVPATGAAVAATDLATSSNLVATGDFSAVGATGSVFTSLGADCTSVAVASLNTAKTTATFTGFAGASLVPTNAFICYTVDGATAVPAQTVTGVLTFAGQVSPAVIPTASNTVGNITRDGTTMVAPLAQIPAGWLSRLVLTNHGSIARAYTVRALDVGGVTATLTGAAASGTLAANSTTVVELPDTMTTSNNRATLVVTVAAPQSTVDGLYQIVNGTSGSISNHVLSYK